MAIETMFVALLCMMFVMLVFIARLCFKIDDLKNTLVITEKRAMKIQDKVEDIHDMTDVLDNRLDPIMYGVNKVQEMVEELCEWEPADEDEEDDLKPGEVETVGELKLRVEVDELPIHLITPNQFMFEAGYDKFELEYSQAFDSLMYRYSDGDEDSWEQFVIGNVEECIGDGLKFFGVSGNDDGRVYVRNNIFHADFMIRKVT